jgi:hypothetical protein
MSSKVIKKTGRNLKAIREVRIERPERKILSLEESLKRINDFEKRKDEFIASIRKSKG